MKRFIWKPQEVKKLLSSNTDSELLSSFPGKSLISLKRRQREFKQQGLCHSQAVSLSDTVDEIIKNLPVIKKLKLPKVKPYVYGHGDEEEAVLLLSDIQIGHRTKSFNRNIAFKRMEFLISKVIRIINLHRSAFPINTLNIFLLGDMIQSEAIGYKVDLDSLESVLSEQIFDGALPILEYAIINLSPHFKKIRVFAVRGNHGSMGKFASDRSNFDDFIYNFLKKRFEDNKRIEFNLTNDFYQIANIKGHKFLLAHGDNISVGSFGVPIYGIIQRVMRWRTGGIGDFDTFVCGHWHQIGNWEWNDIDIITNGTFVSDDEYVRKKLGVKGSTKQVLFGVHKRHRVSFFHKINLNQL